LFILEGVSGLRNINNPAKIAITNTTITAIINPLRPPLFSSGEGAGDFETGEGVGEFDTGAGDGDGEFDTGAGAGDGEFDTGSGAGDGSGHPIAHTIL
jgi:hypothetical protein